MAKFRQRHARDAAKLRVDGTGLARVEIAGSIVGWPSIGFYALQSAMT